MPESVSTVDAILDGLRERATGWSCVPLADAVAAVHAAADARTQEIVEWLTSPDTTDLAVEAFVRDGRSGAATVAQMAAALDALLADLARRFPNGGTHDDAE